MDNIFIIGPYGAGKSSIGYQLGLLLKKPFFDSDREIEKRAGVDIDWMFTIEGEKGFRIRELQIIKELTQMKGVIIATGGGTVVIPECRDLLQKKGTVIYLQVPFEEQLKRIKRSPAKRPTLDEEHPETKLEKLNKEKGYTFCMIEHDMDFIGRLCDPVIVMAEGSVLFEGSVEDAKKDERVIDSYLGRGSKLKDD